MRWLMQKLSLCARNWRAGRGSDDYRQRRREIDARGLQYGVGPDVKVEPVDGERRARRMDVNAAG